MGQNISNESNELLRNALLLQWIATCNDIHSTLPVSHDQLSEVYTNMDNYYCEGPGQQVIATTKLLSKQWHWEAKYICRSA